MTVVSRQPEVVLSSGGLIRALLSTEAKSLPHAFLHFVLRGRDKRVLAEKYDIAIWKRVSLADDASYGMIEVNIPKHVLGTKVEDAGHHVLSMTVYSTRNIEDATLDESSTCQVAVVDLSSKDIRVAWPTALQLGGKVSTLVLALADTPWLPPHIVKKLASSATNAVQLEYTDSSGKLLKRARYAATVRADKPAHCDAHQRAAGFVEVLLPGVPRSCDKAVLQLSVDNFEFVECGQLETVPHFSVVCAFPPVLDASDASSFVIVCSSPSNIAPAQRRRWQQSCPREWSLALRGKHSTAKLPMMLSPPNQEELVLLEDVFGDDQEPGCEAIELVVEDLDAVLNDYAPNFWVAELELIASCRGGTCTIALGAYKGAGATTTRSSLSEEPAKVETSATLKLPLGERVLFDKDRDNIDLGLVLRRTHNWTRNQKPAVVRSLVARGSASVTAPRTTVRLESCHPTCARCDFRLCSTIVAADAADNAKQARHVSIYAFRSCAISVPSLADCKNGVVDARLCASPPPNDDDTRNGVVAPEYYGLASTRWQLSLFIADDWRIDSVDPDSRRVEYTGPVRVRGSDFRFAFGAMLKGCFELESGDVHAQEAHFLEDGTIEFEAPVVYQAQFATLTIAFEFGSATLRSNPLSYEFLPIPDIDEITPRYVPRSTGCSLLVRGGPFVASESLHAFVYSPRVADRKYAEVALRAATEFIDAGWAFSTTTKANKLPAAKKKLAVSVAMAVAASVLATGGTSAAASAAAAAAYLTATTAANLDQIDATVADAIVFAGGTQHVGAVAAEVALSTASLCLGIREPDEDVRPTTAESSDGDCERLAEDIMMRHGEDFAFGLRKSKLAIMASDGEDEIQHLALPVHSCTGSTATCPLPPNIDVDEAYVAFSTTLGFKDTPAFHKTRQVRLFHVGGLWPPCGEMHGGTTLRITGFNFDKFLREQPPVLPERHAPIVEQKSSRQLVAKKQPRVARSGTGSRGARSGDATKPAEAFVGRSPQPPSRSQRRASLTNRPGDTTPPVEPPVDDTPKKILVSFRLVNKTTGKVVQRTMVDGSLLRLTKVQCDQASSAGAFTHVNSSGTLVAPSPEVYLGSRLSLHDSVDCVCTSSNSSLQLGIAATQVGARDEECVIQCKVPPCQATLVDNSEAFVATVEVSLNGQDGPFTADNAHFTYVRQPVLKAVRPAGAQIVPGRTTLALEGQSLGSSQMLWVHLTLITAEAHRSQYSRGRVADRLALPYTRVVCAATPSKDPPPKKTAWGTAQSTDTSDTATEIHAAVPFFIRRRYSNRQPRWVKLNARNSGSRSPTFRPTELVLWIHSQPITDDCARRSRGPFSRASRRSAGSARPMSRTSRRSLRDQPRPSSKASSRASNEDAAAKGAQQHQVREKAEPNCLIQEIGIEVSTNGQHWGERARRTLRLAPPPWLTRLEPASGPSAGGTKVTIRGENFPIGCESCVVAFLCMASRPPSALLESVRDTPHQVAYELFEKRKKSPTDVIAATTTLQRFARGRIYRKLAKQGLPCGLVPGTVTSSRTIVCTTPGSVAGGVTDVVVSFDGRNFEWAPTDKLRMLRIRNALMDEGMAETEAVSTAVQMVRDTAEPPPVVAPNTNKKSGFKNARTMLRLALGATRKLVKRRDAAKQAPFQETFDAKLQLGFEFYAAPEIDSIRKVNAPFTDTLDIIGINFRIGSNLVVRFTPAGYRHPSNKSSFEVPGEVIEEDLVTVVAPKLLLNAHNVDVAVSMNDGVDYSNELRYRVCKVPRLESITPSCGPVTGGSLVVVKGQNLVPKNDVKIRFSKVDETTGEPHKLCVVQAAAESPTSINIRLPNLGRFLSSSAQRDGADEERHHIVRNHATKLVVDMSVDGMTFTEKALDFSVYEHVPRLRHLNPRSGPLTGGYRVKVIGSGFLDTNTLAVRIIPLPKQHQPQPRRRQRRRRSKGDAACRPISGGKTTFVAHDELTFQMPWLLGHEPGQFLVQCSLDGSDFSEPHEQCLFMLYADHRNHRDAFPLICGPDDVSTSRDAWRQWRDLHDARHRPLALSVDTARNNSRASRVVARALTRAHVPTPSLRAILKALVAAVEDSSSHSIDLTAIPAVARSLEAPLRGLDDLPNFDDQLSAPQDGDRRPQWQTETLVLKLQHLIRDDAKSKNLLSVLNRAFFYVTRQHKHQLGLTYGELCDHLLLTLFPTSTHYDLLELWHLVDPAKHGLVTLHAFIARLKGKRPASPTPGPAHYEADALRLRRNLHTVGREPLTLDAYDRPSLLGGGHLRSCTSLH